MVAPLLSEGTRREQWTLQALEQAQMPGGEEDHRWIARNVARALDPLGDEADEVLPAVLSGLLLEMGEDPSKSPDLNGRFFPEGWLESAPALLRSGFPVGAWHLVKAGILQHEKATSNPIGRWRVDAGRVLEELADLYEMGEHLVYQNLAKALVPLVRESPDASFALAGLSGETFRKWKQALQREWERFEFPDPPHVVRI